MDYHANSRPIRRKRPKKDPKAPKKPRSSYILFCTEARPDAKAQNPNASPSELMKILGAKWKQIDHDLKSEYELKAKEDKLRYQEEMKTYVPSSEYVAEMKSARGRGRGRRPKKDPNEPKRALTAYLFFGQHQRPLIKQDFPDAKSSEIMKIIGERWADLTDDDKAPFQEQADQDKERYRQEKSAYEEQKKREAAAARQQMAQHSDDESPAGHSASESEESESD